MIFLKDEYREFSYGDLSDYFSPITTKEIQKTLSKLKINKLKSYKYEYILSLIDYFDLRDNIQFKKYGNSNFLELMDMQLYFYHDAVFNDIECSDYDDIISRMGIWNAQGVCNHEHMNDYVHNKISQFLLSEKIINHWVDCIKKLGNIGDYIVYRNGCDDVTVCVYYLKGISNEMNNFDNIIFKTGCFSVSELL